MQQTIIIPTELGEITLQNYLRFLQRIKGQNEYRTMQLAMQYFCHLPPDAVYSMDVQDIIEATSIISETLSKKPPVLKGDEKATIDGVEYIFCSDKRWTFGEFIDLQEAVASSEDLPLDTIVSITWRKVDSEGNPEPYTAKEKPIEYFPLDLALATANFFSKALESISEEFSELFGSGEDSADYSSRAIFSQRWGWLGKIDTLANGDITKWDAVTEVYFRAALTKIIYDHEKQELISREMRKHTLSAGA